MNIITELRDLAALYGGSLHEDRELCMDLNRIANTLEQSGALVPMPDGNRCLLRHVNTSYVLADDGNIYRKEDGDWWSLYDPFQYLVGLDMFVQPVRLVPIKDANL